MKAARLIAGLFLALGLVMAAGCGGEATPSLQLETLPVMTFGFMPYNDPDHMRGLFDAVAAHLSEHMKVEMRFILAADYQTMGRLMENQMVDLAWFTPASYRRIGKKVGAIGLCKPYRRGRGTYRPIIVVRKDSTAKQLKDLQGKHFAYVERNSTSGFVVPNLMLMHTGVRDPLEFFGEVSFTYAHTASLRGVAAGRYDAAAVYEGLPDEMGPELGRDTFRVLAEGPSVPNDPIAIRPGLPDATVQRVKTLLLDMDKYESGRKALVKLEEIEKITKFIPTDESDYRW